jgi:pyridinium-3,5-biscarboxylic acid mononucleotide sulfurtransferase
MQEAGRPAHRTPARRLGTVTTRGEPQQPLVVGFDLDMTLIDPRPGVVASCAAVTAETGVAIDGDLVASRLGPPLEVELANWVAADRVDELADSYRAHYATIGVDGTSLLPGSVDALAAVRRQGGRTLVVTAKNEANARATLDRLDLPADEVIGNRWGAGKGEALLEHGATVYVGDHTADMLAAATADATAVAVTTGSDSEAALLEAGADVVLRDLNEFPGWLSAYLLPGRLAALQAHLAGLGSVMVAFSGGADSAFLLAAAVRALGPDAVVAATAVSPSLPRTELDAAQEFAASLGVRHITPTTDELARDGYRANDGDRCRFCKSELLEVLTDRKPSVNAAHVLTGTNADDVAAGFRPGIAAAAERGALTPLLDAGLTKDQVRRASRDWGLPTWDKPAAACLSSRIAYGIEVTAQRLTRVEHAEQALRRALVEHGIEVRDLRVRDLGDVARVEVDAAAIPVVAAAPGVLASIQGFASVELDPRGFRSGSMNELLADPAQWR